MSAIQSKPKRGHLQEPERLVLKCLNIKSKNYFTYIFLNNFTQRGHTYIKMYYI